MDSYALTTWASLIFSSFQEWANAMARRPSSVCLTVCPSVCKLSRKSLLLPRKWSDRYQTCTRWTPGQLASRVCSRSRSRSKVTWYAHFLGLGFLELATPSLTVWFNFASSYVSLTYLLTNCIIVSMVTFYYLRQEVLWSGVSVYWLICLLVR